MTTPFVPIAVLAAFLGIVIPVQASAAIITTDFEGLGLAEGDLATNQVPGVTFGGAILVKTGAPEFGFTNAIDGLFDTAQPGESFSGDFISDVPVGGDALVAGTISMTFDLPVSNLSFVVADIDSGIDFSDVFTARAFDASNILIEAIEVTATASPSTGDGIATLIQFTSSNISVVELTLDDGRGRGGWGVDNLSFQPVPEPSTLVIWGLLSVVGFGFSWRQTRKTSSA